jgi:hypothetical protein
MALGRVCVTAVPPLFSIWSVAFLCSSAARSAMRQTDRQTSQHHAHAQAHAHVTVIEQRLVPSYESTDSSGSGLAELRLILTLTRHLLSFFTVSVQFVSRLAGLAGSRAGMACLNFARSVRSLATSRLPAAIIESYSGRSGERKEKCLLFAFLSSPASR